jgi:glycosyltransferase involved in cell wall biosynthesis
MRILIVHNYYQKPGGEDVSTDQDVRLLKRFGHEVNLYSRHNSEIMSYSNFEKGRLFFEPSWSTKSYHQISKVIQEFRPDIVHVQNFFALVSPAIFYACSKFDVPVIFTLHNYRLLCIAGIFFRRGEVCEDCLNGSLWNGIIHSCYHDSLIQSTSLALLLKSHRILKTWRNHVDLFITPTEFSQMKFVEGGIPAPKIVIRNNFVEFDPGVGKHPRKFFIFVGRLSADKGLGVLLEAWKKFPTIELKIVGEGPQRTLLEAYINEHEMDQVELLGFLPMEKMLRILKEATCLVMPSTLYETFGRTIIEAFATATPVIASNLGAMSEIVTDNETGLLFTPGSAGDLRDKVNYALSNPRKLKRWGENARKEYEVKYSDKIAYERLIDIYCSVVKR